MRDQDEVMPVKKSKKQRQLLLEVLPRTGMLYTEESQSMVLCKPRIMPLKSVTLEKLEKMQKEAQEVMRQQEAAAASESSENQQ